MDDVVNITVTAAKKAIPDCDLAAVRKHARRHD